ncbi:MAG: cation:proton antiporter, partial [Myxococcales bacterium]
FLKDLVVVLGAAVVVVAVLRRLGLPSIAGFILTGVLAGPTALGLVDDTRQVETLAEVGVVLLLFGIGLELSLERIRRLWKAVVIGGGVQVIATILCVALLGRAYGLTLGSSIFLGFVIAVSSTAVVLRGLASRGELEAPHGRLAVGILVFQDLCVVPMILIIPLLAGQGGSSHQIGITLSKAILILLGVLVAASVVVPRLLAFVAQTRERELFVLTVFLVCFGTAWAVSLAGVSLALGAFLAGLVVAGSEFRHQAMSDLIPAREVFASLFFVSIGMLLDVNAVIERWAFTLGLLLIILTLKFAIILATARLLRLPLRVAILSAATLCQVGEFSFVLIAAASGTGLLSPLSQDLMVAIILSMLLTPMAIAFGPHLASGAARVPWLNRRLGADPPGLDPDEPHRDHVIVGGYGFAGRALCGAFRKEGLAYVAVDVNPDNVREARAAGDRAVLGDLTHRELLDELGCGQARLVVICINDPRATELAIRTVREVAPDTHILARAQYQMDEPMLREAGANWITSAEATASDSLVDSALRLLGQD